MNIFQKNYAQEHCVAKAYFALCDIFGSILDKNSNP